MKVTLRKVDDVEEAHEIHRLAFPCDHWPGDAHEYWIATDESGHVVGICSCVFWEDIQVVYLSRAAVIKRAQGYGLQRRMIRARVNWARQQGARFICTYCARKNYASMVSLLKSGFRFHVPKNWGRWRYFHIMIRDVIANYDRQLLQKATEKMDEG